MNYGTPGPKPLPARRQDTLFNAHAERQPPSKPGTGRPNDGAGELLVQRVELPRKEELSHIARGKW